MGTSLTAGKYLYVHHRDVGGLTVRMDAIRKWADACGVDLQPRGGSKLSRSRDVANTVITKWAHKSGVPLISQSSGRKPVSTPANLTAPTRHRAQPRVLSTRGAAQSLGERPALSNSRISHAGLRFDRTKLSQSLQLLEQLRNDRVETPARSRAGAWSSRSFGEGSLRVHQLEDSVAGRISSRKEHSAGQKSLRRMRLNDSITRRPSGAGSGDDVDMRHESSEHPRASSASSPGYAFSRRMSSTEIKARTVTMAMEGLIGADEKESRTAPFYSMTSWRVIAAAVETWKHLTPLEAALTQWRVVVAEKVWLQEQWEEFDAYVEYNSMKCSLRRWNDWSFSRCVEEEALALVVALSRQFALSTYMETWRQVSLSLCEREQERAQLRMVTQLELCQRAVGHWREQTQLEMEIQDSDDKAMTLWQHFHFRASIQHWRGVVLTGVQSEAVMLGCLTYWNHSKVYTSLDCLTQWQQPDM